MTQPTTFVLTVGDRPYAAASDFDTAQADSLAAETRYQSTPREYRWDQVTTWQAGNGRAWNLMVRSERTKRWNKTMRSIVEVRIVSPASTTEETPR